MKRRSLKLAFLLAGGLSLSATGCSTSLFTAETWKSMNLKPNMIEYGTEQRAINSFTEALAEDKEAAFRRTVSTRFEQQALRSKDSYKDLEILSLPKEKLEIVESKETDDNKLEVVAKLKEGTTKYQFIIVRDSEKHRWVVDDVLLRQQRRGTRATKSAVEVMDLLITIREFIDTWQSGDRNAVLQVVSTELREPLESLPEPWMQQIMARVSAEHEEGMARRPEAQMNDSDAVVKLPSKNGFLLLKVVQQDDQWLVSDIEVRQRKVEHHPGSILRQARALNAITSFLAAYSEKDISKLESLTERTFYEGALKVGDLSMVHLPAANYAPEDFDIQSFAGQLTVTIPERSEVVRLDLTTPEAAEEKRENRIKGETVESKFIVSDVTIYNRQTQQQKNLRSAFTAPARAMLFLSAVQGRELPVLRQISTQRLNEAAWSQMQPELFRIMDIEGLPQGELTLERSTARGDLTELEFASASGQICSVIMRDENGNLLVDDVEYPGRTMEIASLKSTLMLTGPVTELAGAWGRQDFDGVRQRCSTKFNNLVWANVVELPGNLNHLPTALAQPVRKVNEAGELAMVELGDEQSAHVTVHLVRENTAWVVDEIILSPPGGAVVELRKELRREVSKQILASPSGEIRKAGFDLGTSSEDQGVIQAVDRRSATASRVGNLTLPPGTPSGRAPAKAPPKKTSTGAASRDAIDMTEEQMELTDEMMVPESAEESGLIKFGPAPRSSQQTPSSNLKRTPNMGASVRPMVDPTVEDGAIHFNGAPKPAKKTPVAETIRDDEESKTSLRNEGINPAANPVEIPE
ncbi:MAG: hypothetical protein U0996_06950 [Planctomycetaceae bacterium]